MVPSRRATHVLDRRLVRGIRISRAGDCGGGVLAARSPRRQLAGSMVGLAGLGLADKHHVDARMEQRARGGVLQPRIPIQCNDERLSLWASRMGRRFRRAAIATRQAKNESSALVRLARYTESLRWHGDSPLTRTAYTCRAFVIVNLVAASRAHQLRNSV